MISAVKHVIESHPPENGAMSVCVYCVYEGETID